MSVKVNKSSSLLVSLSLYFVMLTACQSSNPVEIYRPTPLYPGDAALSCIEGYVQLQFVIKADGTTRNVSVVKSEPEKVFDSAAIDAVSKWQFKPNIKNGEAVEQKAVQNLQFKLSGQCTKRLVEKSYFDFTDGISEEEAFYIAQDVCIQTGKDKTLDIFNPSFTNNKDSYSFGYSPSEETVSKMADDSNELTLNDFLPFLIFIDKQTGKVTHSVYEINKTTNKIDVTVEKPTTRFEKAVNVSDSSIAILEVISKEIEGFVYNKTHKFPYPNGYSLRYFDKVNQLIYADVYIYPIPEELDEYNVKEMIDIATEISLKGILHAKEQGQYTELDIIKDTSIDINENYTSKVDVFLVRENLALYSLLFVSKSKGELIKARITMPDNTSHRENPRWQKFVEKIFVEIDSHGHQ